MTSKKSKKGGCINYKDALKKVKDDDAINKASLKAASINDELMDNYMDASMDDADEIFNEIDAANALYPSTIISSINDIKDDASINNKADKRHIKKGRQGRRMKQMLNGKVDDDTLIKIVKKAKADIDANEQKYKDIYYDNYKIISLKDKDAADNINYNFNIIKQMYEYSSTHINSCFTMVEAGQKYLFNRYNDNKDEISALKAEIDALKADKDNEIKALKAEIDALKADKDNKADADADKAEIIKVINYNADIINSYKAEIDALKDEISLLKAASINKADDKAEIVKADDNYQLSVIVINYLIRMLYYFISGCIYNVINYIIISPINFIKGIIINSYKGCINYIIKIRKKYYNYKIMKYRCKIMKYKNKIMDITI